MRAQHDRETLLQHLEAIQVRGIIPEAVFAEDGSTQVTDTTTHLAVQAPSLGYRSLLGRELPLHNLGMLIKALDQLEKSTVTLSVMDHVLTLEEACYHQPLMRPDQVQTKVPESLRKQLEEPNLKDSVPLGSKGLQRVLYHDRLIDAKTASVEVSPDGTRIVIGMETGAHGDPRLPSLTSDKSYELTINFEHLAKVLRTAGTDGRLYLSGPESPLVVDRNGYRYLLAPLAEEVGS